MYAINSLRFILLVDGHCRFLMVDACFRRSLTECLAVEEVARVSANANYKPKISSRLEIYGFRVDGFTVMKRQFALIDRL